MHTVSKTAEGQTWTSHRKRNGKEPDFVALMYCRAARWPDSRSRTRQDFIHFHEYGNRVIHEVETGQTFTPDEKFIRPPSSLQLINLHCAKYHSRILQNRKFLRRRRMITHGSRGCLRSGNCIRNPQSKIFNAVRSKSKYINLNSKRSD